MATGGKPRPLPFSSAAGILPAESMGLEQRGQAMRTCVRRDEALKILGLIQLHGSVHKAARACGRARGTVAAIARGEHPALVAPPPRDDDIWVDPGRPYIRCRCGHRVQFPCRICLARAGRALARFAGRIRLFQEALGDRPLGLDLRPEDRRRYEPIHAAKMRQLSLDFGSAAESRTSLPGPLGYQPR